MVEIYYIEINAVCIAVLILLYMQLRQDHGQQSAAARLLYLLMLAAIILCLSDMISGILRGKTFAGAHWMTETSNIIYFIMATAISYLWALYVNVKLGHPISRKNALLWAVPLLIILLIGVTNPWTEILFSLNAGNYYSRGRGISLHWLINWMYLLVPSFQIIQKMTHEKNRNRRHDLVTLLSFIIAPTVASILQMMFYGVSCFQAGITISILIVVLLEQNSQIQSDALTGLNNRRGFDSYMDEFFRRRENSELFVLMIDIDSFKQINDRFGHSAGDQALKDTADILKQVCAVSASRLFLCRYGGDEFVIAGHSSSAEYSEHLKRDILESFQNHHPTDRKPYTLSVSIGTASGKCSGAEDAENLLHSADDAMYSDKKHS